MVRNWIVDLKGTGIRVNVASPGMIYTPVYDNLFGDARNLVLESAKTTVPLCRVSKSEEIANAVAFLASEESSYVNGVQLFVVGLS